MSSVKEMTTTVWSGLLLVFLSVFLGLGMFATGLLLIAGTRQACVVAGENLCVSLPVAIVVLAGYFGYLTGSLCGFWK